jgi:ParB/RepB/Spo0J family partition protein
LREAAHQQFTVINVSDIEANPYLAFEKRDRSNLQESIRHYGLLQNVIVRPHPKKKEKYELIAGMGRLEIAKKTHAKTIPAVVRQCDGRTAIMLNAVENFNRADLSPTQEADLVSLLVSLKFKDAEIARELGISRAQVGQRVILEEAMMLHQQLRRKLDRGLVAPSSVEYVYSKIKNRKVRDDIVETLIEKELSLESTVRLVEGSRAAAKLHDQADDYKKQEERSRESPAEQNKENQEDVENETAKAESRHQGPRTLTLSLLEIEKGLVLEDRRVRDARNGHVYDLPDLLRNLLASKVHAGDFLQVIVKQTITPTETAKQLVHA